MNISEHITLDEATHSDTGIRKGIVNIPNEATMDRMKIVAEACFEPLRKHFGALRVNSFYRCPELNEAVGGKTSPISQHTKGEAIDISGLNGVTNKQIHDWAKANLIFDQLICEYPDKNGNPSWVHISFTKTHTNRNQSFDIT